MMSGKTSSASVHAPASRQRPNCSKVTNKASPNSPYTTEGTPARLTIAKRISLTSLPARAYSLRYTAAATPTGTEIRAVSVTRAVVPTIAGSRPPSTEVSILHVTARPPLANMAASTAAAGRITAAAAAHKRAKAAACAALGESRGSALTWPYLPSARRPDPRWCSWRT